MTRPSLEPDCANCAALCCIALAFDRGADFAIDKPAGTPCPNLDGHACRIHADLAESGFEGCVRYSCRGAGQRVVAELFPGRSWQNEPRLVAPMMEAFRAMRAVQDRLELLAAAEALPLSESDAATRARLESALYPGNLTAQTLATFETGPLAVEIDAFIGGLRRYLPSHQTAADNP